MIAQLKKISVPNGVLFVTDAQGGIEPAPIRGAQVLSTPSCVAFACQIDCEGETTISAGDAKDSHSDKRLLFDGVLETPSRHLIISNVERLSVLTAPVPNPHTRIRIWTNRALQPDEISIDLE